MWNPVRGSQGVYNTLKFLVYNIHHGVGCDGREDLERIAHVIERSGADIVGLNEVDVNFHRRSGFVDQVAWLSKRLKMEGVFGPAIAIKDPFRHTTRQYGNALLSKFPIQEYRNEAFSGRIGDEPRSLLRVKLEHEGRMFQAFVTHMGLTPWMRNRQTRKIVELCQDNQLPLVVMGDWNVLPDHSEVRRLSPYLLDVATTIVGSGFTYPCKAPRKRIDYIFCSCHFQVKVAQIISTPDCPSDHLPVYCQLDWKEEE